MTRQQPDQQAPPVQRLRIKYAKRGRARFTSHRDFSRAFERALRRAGVPMAYSSGFSPHPRISYANAAPTGAASEAEYLEIGLAVTCDPAKVLTALDSALPPGLDLVHVWPAESEALADQLTGSAWTVAWPVVDAGALADAVSAFLTESQVLVQRMTKNGLREFDARAAVLRLEVTATGLAMTLRHQVPLVRPDDVLAGLAILRPEVRVGDVAVLTRLTQGRLDERTGAITEPG